MAAINQLLKPQWLLCLKNLTMVLSYIKLFRGMGLVFQESSRTLSDTDSVEPLLSALVHATLGMRLAQQFDDQTMMMANAISLLVNLGALGFYYCYATSCLKSRIWEKTLVIIGLIATCLCYSSINKPETVKCHLSILMTGIESVLIVKGLLKRSCDGFGGMLSTLIVISKLLYALSIQNSLMLYQHLVVLFLNLLRLQFWITGDRYERCFFASFTSIQQQVADKISRKSLSIKMMIENMD